MGPSPPLGSDCWDCWCTESLGPHVERMSRVWGDHADRRGGPCVSPPLSEAADLLGRVGGDAELWSASPGAQAWS